MATPTTLPATFVAGDILTAAQMNALRGAFRILQVVEGTTTTTVTTSSLTYVTTGLTATITPSSTSSKVLVVATSVMGGTNNFSVVTSGLFRGTVAGTNIGEMAFITNTDFAVSQSIIKLDSPNTASAQTYTLGIKTGSASNAAYANRFSSFGSIILMEISA